MDLNIKKFCYKVFLKKVYVIILQYVCIREVDLNQEIIYLIGVLYQLGLFQGEVGRREGVIFIVCMFSLFNGGGW